MSIEFDPLVYVREVMESNATEDRKAALLFRPYLGNHHRWLPRPPYRLGGMFSVARHLGKPLSVDLWMDVFHRLNLGGLSLFVFHYGEERWTIGRSGPLVEIDLDKDENVVDILIQL